MRIALPVLLAAGLLAGMLVVPLLADNLLTNTDFKEGIEGWHGDADSAFLKPDGTEGQEGDPGVIPVIKLPLARGSAHSVYQDFETHNKPTSLHVSVQVFASTDFARSKFPDDYSVDWKPGGVWYWSAIAIPNVDFWIRGGGSSWFYKMTNLKPGAWTTLAGQIDGLPADEDRTMSFCVPPGTGVVYIKNPAVEL